jgi:hypothetical protein
MYLFSYDISGKRDPHGLRVRLNYLLTKYNCIHLLRSLWILPQAILDIKEFKSLLNELKFHSFPFILNEWQPISPFKSRAIDNTYKIGIIIHGPEVIDSGNAKKVIDFIREKDFRFKTLLGGTMGKIALIDSDLKNLVPLDFELKPSECIDYFLIRNYDCIVLINQARSTESGKRLGYQIYNNSKLASHYTHIPIIQLDLIGTSEGFVIEWNLDHSKILDILAEKFNAKILLKDKVSNDIDLVIFEKNGYTIREVAAVENDDWIMVSGYIIGKIVDKNVKIVSKNGYIDKNKTEGIEINEHGLEKLGKVDLHKVRITTLKKLRRTEPFSLGEKKYPRRKKAVLIKKAEEVFQYIERADIIISIGDDTSFLTHEFLKRFPDKKHIGIIDMDGELYKDKNLENLYPNISENTMIFQVDKGTDDIIGNKINKEFFHNKKFYNYDDFYDFFKNFEKYLDPFYITKIKNY